MPIGRPPAKNRKAEGYLSIAQLQARWGVSRQPIFTLVKEGAITQHKIDGCSYFVITDVEMIEHSGMRPEPKAIQNRFKGRQLTTIVPEAFRMFREGATLTDVVINLRITPEVADRLYADYVKPDMAERYRARIARGDIPDPIL